MLFFRCVPPRILTFYKTVRSAARHGGERGAVAVSVALLLTVLLAVMALAMDTGYLVLKKNTYQNGVEAAALAGVLQLCDGNWEAVARQVAEDNGIPSVGASLTVETGFYDETDEFSGALSTYKDFGPPPSGRFINAVHVRLSHDLSSLTGMNAAATVVAEAVAYLKRIDIASLDPDGFIRLGHNSIWKNTTFFANGNILWPQQATAKISGAITTYQPPEFNNSLVLAADEVAACPVEVTNVGWTGQQKMTILWDAGTSQSAGYIHVNMDPLTEIRPMDEDTLNDWRDRADKVYSLGEAGVDNVYYGQSSCPYPLTGTTCHFFDLARASSNRKIIFFDAQESGGSVMIGPNPGNASIIHLPNGYTIAGLTFVANCPISLINLMETTTGDHNLYVGGEDEEQTLIISSETIEVYPGSGSTIRFDGAVFRAGGDFIKYETGSDYDQHIRVIADGSIYGEKSSMYKNNPGMNGFTNNSQFGPPCPPDIARLGRLETSE